MREWVRLLLDKFISLFSLLALGSVQLDWSRFFSVSSSRRRRLLLLMKRKRKERRL